MISVSTQEKDHMQTKLIDLIQLAKKAGLGCTPQKI
jgi:hypothetical protein